MKIRSRIVALVALCLGVSANLYAQNSGSSNSSTEASKAREAAITDQQREAEALARQQREAAWIARCNIQPVMTDEAIATCRQVMTRPAPKVVPHQEVY